MSGSAEATPPKASDPALRDQVATIASDPFRFVYGGRLLSEDAILRTRGAGRGLWLYDEVARDPQVATVLQKRQAALIGREWSVDAADDSAQGQDAADLVRRALTFCKLNLALEKLLDALLKGISIMEVMWVVRGDELLPGRLLHRDGRRFVWRVPTVAGAAAGAELRLLTKTQPTEGVQVPPCKFLIHRKGGLYEDPWGLGLGSRLFWPVWFKRQGIGFWLSALEKFGQPTAVGKYPQGTTEDQQDKLLAALGAVASEAGVAIPEGMAIELLEAKRAGTFDAYESLARYMDEDISKVVLGETLTTSAGATGSRALGQVHNDVRLEITKSDADQLSDSLDDLVRWIVDLNRPGYAALGLNYPRVWWDISEPEDLAARAKRDVDIRSLGYRPVHEYITATYGEGWEPEPSAPAAQDQLQAMFAEAKVTARPSKLPPAADPRDAAGLLADQLDQVSADAQAAIVDQLRALVNRADSLDQLRDELLQLYPQLPVSQLAELMGQALTVAALTGRADLADGL